jgi:hypothetical protein
MPTQTNANEVYRNVTSLQLRWLCIGYLEFKPMNDFKHMNKSEWIAFLLFNILDHICTTSFVFANPLEIYSKTFANSQGIGIWLQEAFLEFEISPPVSNAFPLTV